MRLRPAVGSPSRAQQALRLAKAAMVTRERGRSAGRYAETEDAREEGRLGQPCSAFGASIARNGGLGRVDTRSAAGR